MGIPGCFCNTATAFFLNDDSSFFITNDGITEVSRTIQRTQVLDIPTKGNIAFDGRTIYFINENSLLTAYDTKTHKDKAVSECCCLPTSA